MIFIKNITKQFDTKKALDNISLEIKQGEMILLKGKSGSGKSTLLSLLSGMSKPTNGSIIINNEDITKLSEKYAATFRLKNIGFIFQKFHLFPLFDVAQNLALPLIPLNLPQDVIENKIDTLLKQFDLEEKKHTLLKHLSGGEQQRVAIARSLMNDPKIIIADEPTANLDETLSKNFIKFLLQLKNQQRTIIIATHDPLFFDLDCIDKTYELKGGKCF